VVASSSEAHVQFVAPNLQLHSRDLNLSTGVWESSYVVQTSTAPILSLSATTLGNTIFCLVAQEPTLINANHQIQTFYLTNRNASDGTWGAAQWVTETTLGVGYGYMRKTIISSPPNASVQKVYVATTCNYNPFWGCIDGLGITLRTYSSTGTLESVETIHQGSQFQSVDAASVFLTSGVVGQYTFWPGSMRRKPFAITGAIAERMLLTGNNWVSGTSAAFNNNTMDALTNSVTTFFDNSGLTLGGSTLNANAGAQFKFGTNAWLSIYGILNTHGSPTSPAVFTATNPSSPWYGIYVQSNGAVCVLNYADISYASGYGLFIDNSRLFMYDSRVHHCFIGVLLQNLTHPKNAVTIERSTIDYNNTQFYGHGIRVENARFVTLRNNTITNNFYGVGLELSSTARLFGNQINTNWFGVYAGGTSDLRMGDMVVGLYGNNCASQNSSTVVNVVDNSTGFLGLSTANGVMGGYNSLVWRTGPPPTYGYAVYAQFGSTVTAQKNWWGLAPPNPAWFNATGGSTIDYSNWLSATTCEPSGSSPIVKGDGGGSVLNGLDSEQELLMQALVHRGARNFAEAATIYRDIVRTSPDSPEARTALLEVRNTYHDFASWSNDPSVRALMRAYLQQQANGHPNGSLRRIAKAVRAAELVANQQYSQAEGDFEALLASSSSDDERKNLVYSLFSLHLSGTGDHVAAAQYLQRLQRDWPLDKNTKVAEMLFESRTFRSGNPIIGKGRVDEPVTSTVPTEFMLAQNYPNPFNPMTSIRFQIPHEGFVSLKVYNMLGQEVATLVNEARDAGIYTETFNAAHLASGVYIYKLMFGNLAASKKLVLVR
jgi:parallel beta-helix repeat protein